MPYITVGKENSGTVNCWRFLEKIREALKQPEGHGAMAAGGRVHWPPWRGDWSVRRTALKDGSGTT